MRELWTVAGLDAVETKEIAVQRTFADFDDFWTICLGSSVGPQVAAMSYRDVEVLKARCAHVCQQILRAASLMVHAPTR